MVSEELLDPACVVFEEWAVTPDEDTLVPDGVQREQASADFQERLRNNPEAIILTHGDADGLTSAALAWITEGASNIAVKTVSYNGPYTFETAMHDLTIADVEDTPIYVLDFNPDSTEQVEDLAGLVEDGNRVTWYDHHQWDDDALSQYSNAGARITVDVSECTASLMLHDLDWSFSEHIRELVRVTKDRDLWINEDPRSKDLATFAEVSLNPYEYIQTTTEHGVDFPEDVHQRIDEEQLLNERLKEYAVENAVGYQTEGYNVFLSYVSGGVRSEMGNALCEDGDADIAVILSPTGGASIYSHSDRETFAKCHEVAGVLGGGGHPTASGFGIPFKNFRDMAQYWGTEGRSHHPEVLNAIDEVVRDE